MNRTQRAVKKACHKAFDSAKREKRQALYERNESSWKDFTKKATNLKEKVKNEKGLKTWHRKMVQDYAVKTSVKEIKIA